jgi:hypothetical protein
MPSQPGGGIARITYGEHMQNFHIEHFIGLGHQIFHQELGLAAAAADKNPAPLFDGLAGLAYGSQLLLVHQRPFFMVVHFLF